MNASSITTAEIIKKLAKRGHDVFLLVPVRCPDECVVSCSMRCYENNKVTVTRIPTIVPYYIVNMHRRMRAFALMLCHVPLFLQALKTGKRRKFDVIVSQHHSSHLASLSAFLLSRVFSLPWIVKTHDVYDTASSVIEIIFLRLLDNLYRLILKRADYVLVVSEPLRKMVIKTHGLEKDRVVVFPNGVDLEKFKLNIRSTSLKSLLEIENKKIILFIGALKEERGLSLLVRALPKIVTKRSDVLVLILGDGPEKSRLEELAEEMGVEQFVRFMPPVKYDEVPNHIHLAHVTIGPLVSMLDTFGSVPRKVVEYMACGKPTVASWGGISEDLIRDGYNGFLVERENANELAAVILKLLNDPILAKKIGLNARRYVEKFYDMETLMDTFEIFLSKVSPTER